jgi:hypothetical protein
LAIATVARVVYNENYVARRMWHGTDVSEASLTRSGMVEYGWMERTGRNFLKVRATGKAEALIGGSEEEFITEHYWGYAVQRDGGTVEYQVEHPSWRVWQVSEVEFDCDIDRVYGEKFVRALSAKPSSAFVADGSPVIVRKGVRL